MPYKIFITTEDGTEHVYGTTFNIREDAEEKSEQIASHENYHGQRISNVVIERFGPLWK